MATRDNSPPEDKSNEKPKRQPTLLSGPWWILIVITLALFVFLLMREQYLGNTRIPYSEFKLQLSRGNVKNVRIGTTVIRGELHDWTQLGSEYKKAAAIPTIPSQRYAPMIKNSMPSWIKLVLVVWKVTITKPIPQERSPRCSSTWRPY